MAAPLTISPRQNTTQQMNTERFVVNFGDTTKLVGSIPVNSFISKVEAYVGTAFNAGTTNVLTLGTTQANANELLASGDVTATATGYYTNARGLGTGLTQSAGAASSVGDPEGGVGIWAKFAPTGTAATAGQAIILVSFMPPNDG